MANKKNTSKKTGTKNKSKKTQSDNQSVTPYIITTLLISLFLGIFMYINTDGAGIINTAVRSFFCGLFGRAGFLLPAASLGMMIYAAIFQDINKFWKKLIFVLSAIINIAALSGLYNNGDLSTAYSLGANDFIGGGLIGTAVSYALVSLFQKLASYIILIITMIILTGFVIGVPIFKLLGYGTQRTADGARNKYNKIKTKYAELDSSDSGEKISIIETAKEFASDLKNKTLKFEKPEDTALPEPKKRDDKPVENFDYSNGIDEVFGDLMPVSKKEPKKKSDNFDKSDVVPPSEIKDNTPESETDEPEAKKKEKNITETERQTYHEEFSNAMEAPVREYVYPTLDLLNPPKAISGDRREELRHTAEKLIHILDDFGVKAKLLQVTQGPTVTRFEIQPDTGIKLSKIVGLADDIALNLAVSTVLVAPVQGKAAVGIEIPNTSVATVSIREMLESDKFKKAKSKLTVALGKDIGGNVVIGDIAKMPHVLIAGATGSGKSVCINTIIMSLLYKASPEEVKLIMVDPKVVELGVYNGIPHLLVPVVTEAKKAAGALNWAVAEMMRRYELFKETGVRKLESYNELMESRGEDKVPQLVIIIDELADLMMVAAKEVEDYICRLAQLARAAGIHLIIATQRPSVDVITGLIKANIPSRIAFAVSSQVDSRTILDKGGAEKLLGMGDMLYYPMGARETTRVQGAFVSDAEIERILEFIKETTEPNHYSEDLAEHIERCATGENGVTPDTDEDGDALLPDAISLAVELGKISTSMVQRRLGVGYSRAGRIIDQMEARGIISGANGSKPRDVLISHADMNVINDNDYEE